MGRSLLKFTALSHRALCHHAFSPRALSTDGLSENVSYSESYEASPVLLIYDVKKPIFNRHP